MAVVSSLGSASGLQLQDLLDKLQTAEQAPLKLIQTQQTAYQAKLSAYGTLQSVLTAFQAAGDKLAAAATFSAVKATSSSTDTIGVATSANAVAGSYAINVTSLAQAQSVVSTGQASQTAAVATGALPATLTFDFGTVTGYDTATGKYTNPGFTPTAGATKTVTIDSSNNTLQGVRDAINKANIGVTASIVNDGSGTPYRLVVTSNNTGAANSMRISSGDAGLQGVIGFDPAAMDPNTATTANGVRETIRGTNASLTVNGIAVTSAGNTVTDAAQGVTLTLNKLGSSTVNVTRDMDSIKAAVTGFATAYNNLQSTASKLTAFDATNKTSSALTGDGVLRNIQVRLRGVLNTAQTGGTLTTLSQVGVSFQKDGTLTVDDAKLTKALNDNLGAVTQLFGGDGKTGGYGRQISDTIKGFTTTDGALKNAQDGLTKTLKDLTDNYNKQQDRINDTIDRYRTQFTALDLAVARLNQTSSYLTQQFNALNGSSKK